MSVDKQSGRFNLIEDSYIYLYHTDEFVLLPTLPESISDSMQTTFAETNALARSAPVFTFSHAGPRTVQMTLSLHRDMMQQVNYGVSNLNIEVGDDYVDSLIKKIQSISVPNYRDASKSVIPPMVAVRLSNEVFVKGIVNSNIGVTYNKPILRNGKYASVAITFSVTEVDPYDANTIAEKGSFRGITRLNLSKLYKEN